MTTTDLAIVIPVYNDWDSLYILLERLERGLSHQAKTAKIVIVDDYSTESAATFSKKCGRSAFHAISRIVQIRLNRNMGHQGAIVLGICHILQQEKTDCIVIMDADGEDRPEDIEKLIAMMEKNQGRAIVFARRRKRSESLFFRFMYALFKMLHYLLTGKSMDFGNFSAIPRELAEALVCFHELWNHYPATAVKSRLPVQKVACDRGRRIDGKSKMSITALILHGLGSISVFAPVVGTRMLLVFSGLTLLFIAGIFCIFGIKFFTDLAIPGWATYTTGILGLLIFQSLSLSLLFVFFILNSKNPSQPVPKQNFFFFIEKAETLWDRDDRS